jgi:regulatory protein
LALRYVERYATSRARLLAYLDRKLRERGWAGTDPPAVEALAARFVELRYVDDAAFAVARAAGLTRRGYGIRRVSASLKAAGIEAEDSAAAEGQAREAAWTAALTFARRRLIGPYAEETPDRKAREKAFAALLRAGHEMDIARLIVRAEPGDVPQLDQG